MYLAKSNNLISSIHPDAIPIIILLVSVVALTIIIERMVYFWRIANIDLKDFREFKEKIKDKDWNSALTVLSKYDTNPTSKVLKVGIESKMNGSSFVEDDMQTEGYKQILKMERFLTGLGTIATIGPLLGVLGTVTGMIRSFSEGTGTKGSEVGISEALITTAMGLGVAIPAYIFYNYLVRKKEEKVIEMENLVTQTTQVLK